MTELVAAREFPDRYPAGDNRGDQFQLEDSGASGWYEQLCTSLA